MIAHRKEGNLVGWIFACPEHLDTGHDVVLMPANELLDYLKNFASLGLEGSIKDQVHTVVMHYATQIGRWEH